MYNQLHANIVLYRNGAPDESRFRQIAVVEKQQFEVRIFSGDLLQPDPNLIADNPDAQVYFHNDLNSALADARSEAAQSAQDGWELYHA